MIDRPSSNYKWYILAMGTATHILVFAMPRMCMPVLFKEISDDLGLNLVEIGTIWGMVGLAGLFTAFAYGIIGDRYGTKLILGMACLLLGIAGALRGLAVDFTTMAVYTFLFGFFSSPISFTTHKAAGQWFSGKQLGLANGILAMGMGVGFVLGSMLSATVLAPLLGGWRNIMFVYGGISVVFSLFWFQTRTSTYQREKVQSTGFTAYRQSLLHVIRIKSVWLFAATQMLISGCRTGFSGYFPLYLRNIGWTPVAADGAISAWSAASVIGVIPLTLLSDRIGIRKVIIYPSIIAMVTGIGLLSIFTGGMVWPLVILASTAQEALAAILITMIMETEGIGAAYAGTALGLNTTAALLGNFFSPPLGNRLAVINPSLAFVFWAGLALIGLVAFHFTRETGWSKENKLENIIAADD